MKIRKWLCFPLLLLALQDYAQTRTIDYSVIHPAEWVTQQTDTLDYSIGMYDGKTAFFLKRKFGNAKSASLAYPKSLDFKDGIIELDIASPAGKNGFAGIAFRIHDPHHYETLYFRPGSSGTISAVQYMPEKNPEFNWWDYEDDKYQATATLPLTGWFHVKAIVKGRTLRVFLNDQKQPVMVRNDLDPGLQNGSVGFWLGNCTAGTYANLKIEKFKP
jgi:hypothetical protein